MKLLSKVMLAIAALVLVGLTSGTSYADGIVLVSPEIQKLVPPLAALNLQHQGNSTFEAGGGSWARSKQLSARGNMGGTHSPTKSLDGFGGGAANGLRVLAHFQQ